MIELLRVDHRLIHGQTGVFWTAHLHADCILICSDRLLQDPVRLSAVKLSKPMGVKLVIKNVADSIRVINSGVTDKYKLFILVESVADAYRLTKGVDAIRSVNIGGMKAADDRRQIAKAVFVSEEDEAMLKEMHEKGIALEVRLVPSDHKQDLMDLLK